MPLEIRELHIQARIEETPSQLAEELLDVAMPSEEVDKERIIEEVIEAVLQIMEQKKER